MKNRCLTFTTYYGMQTQSVMEFGSWRSSIQSLRTRKTHQKGKHKCQVCISKHLFWLLYVSALCQSLPFLSPQLSCVVDGCPSTHGCIYAWKHLDKRPFQPCTLQRDLLWIPRRSLKHKMKKPVIPMIGKHSKHCSLHGQRVLSHQLKSKVREGSQDRGVSSLEAVQLRSALFRAQVWESKRKT